MPNHDPVVSDTTPLITLTEVGLLDVLRLLYGEIWIPDAVRDEYQAGQTRFPNRPELDRLPWISVHRVSPGPVAVMILDAGEAAAIELARECHARLILLDERRGRRAAVRLGLSVAGSLAVLVAAKERGLVPAVGPILEQIIAQGRWIGPDVKHQILVLAGEAPGD